METLEDYLQYAEEILKSPSIRFETAEAQNQTKTRVLTSYTAFVCKGCIRNDNEVSCESLVRGVSLRTLITLRGRFTPKTSSKGCSFAIEGITKESLSCKRCFIQNYQGVRLLLAIIFHTELRFSAAALAAATKKEEFI